MKRTILLALSLLFASSSFCQWTYRYRYNEFGDNALNKHIEYTTENAFFSKEGKIKVNKKQLKVKIEILEHIENQKNPVFINFRLFETNNNKAINSISCFAGKIEFHIMLSDGLILIYPMFATSTSLTTMQFLDDYGLMELLQKETRPIRCLIKIDAFHTISQYHFSIDPRGFARIFNRQMFINDRLKNAQRTTEYVPYQYFTEDQDVISDPVEAFEQPFLFPGGDEALMRFIHDNLKYPKDAAIAGIEGRVTLRLIITIDGDIINVEVIRGHNPSCNKEAIRVVKMMPKWIPNRLNGQIEAVYYTLPIVFKPQKKMSDY